MNDNIASSTEFIPDGATVEGGPMHRCEAWAHGLPCHKAEADHPNVVPNRPEYDHAYQPCHLPAPRPPEPDRTAALVEAVEGVVRYMRSSIDEPKVCICCPGEPSHVFGYFIEVAEGTPERGPDGSLYGGGGGWVTRAIRRLPDGTPVRLSLAATPEPAT
jgi:hypothetical protein